MAIRCNFALLLCAILSQVGFPRSTCHAQDHLRLQRTWPSGQTSEIVNRFDSSEIPSRLVSSNPLPAQNWQQYPPSRFPPTQFSSSVADGGGNAAESAAYFYSNYNPTRIDAARQTAMQLRARSGFNVPKIAELSGANSDIVDQWVQLAEAINSLSTRVANTKDRLQSATRDYRGVQWELHQHATTAALGQLLRHKRKQLDDWQVEGTSVSYSNDDLIENQQRQLDGKLLEYDGRDVVGQANEILAVLRADLSSGDRTRLTPQIQSLLRERSEWLIMLKQGYNDYRQMLGDLVSVSASLNKLLGDYRKLINRHVIWIRSNESIGLEDVQKAQVGFGSVFSSKRSLDIGHSLRQKWKNDSVGGWITVAAAVTILILRSFSKSWLIGIGKRKTMRESGDSARKCAASLLTLAVAIAIPSILYLLARWLGSGYVTESTLQIANGFYAAGLVALVVELPRQLLRKYGFVEKHLHIDLPRQKRAAAYLLVIGIGLVLAAYVVTIAGKVDHEAWSGSVARLGLMAAMLLVAWTAHLAFKPSRGFLEPIVEKFGGTIFYRIRVLFYLLGAGFPLAMIGLSALGYDYTATEILQRAAITFASILIGATLWAAVKIISSSAWHKLTSTRDDRLLGAYGEVGEPRVSGVLAAHSLELKNQLAFLSQCALVLAAIASVGWLWVDIFPDVRLGNPVLWTVDESSTHSLLDAEGQSVDRSYSQEVPITLLHLVLAGATLFVAFQLAKLLPGIFDALILQHVNFDEAMEHLSLVLGRGLLFGVGCFVACRLVGIRWEVIQWLAVGLSIGIGFGLQDIVKNLLGGLIVLFEKPARRGDLVTVGGVTGRVSIQKLRTTTLSDEDGREVIVPNKSFISQEVVNWMGAGRLKAIPIEVAVTRDQLPAEVCRMLQHLMVAQPELLLSPAPQATLICVGQQSQRIGLLAWVEELHDPVRYRETLLKIVLRFLDEKNLLTLNQPRQPLMDYSPVVNKDRGMHRGKRRAA